ncbi:hypothetical protein DRO64_10330 [Candidatus Bathyarchaeota archaeon]|nr:MAG: hypothetical protein DRO64_10330 [Candidatus Bathyarchaeota archaeon]
MSELRVYVEDNDGKKISFIVHYGTGCRLVSAIDENVHNFQSLLDSAYEFDRGIFEDVEYNADNKRNYSRWVKHYRSMGLSRIPLKPYPNKEPYDAGIIEIYFPKKLIISDQSGDYICHRGVRETWGYTGPHRDVGRFKKFEIPSEWTIIDKYFFGKSVKIEGELDKILERKLWERVEWYKKNGYLVTII